MYNTSLSVGLLVNVRQYTYIVSPHKVNVTLLKTIFHESRRQTKQLRTQVRDCRAEGCINTSRNVSIHTSFINLLYILYNLGTSYHSYSSLADVNAWVRARDFSFVFRTNHIELPKLASTALRNSINRTLNMAVLVSIHQI